MRSRLLLLVVPAASLALLSSASAQTPRDRTDIPPAQKSSPTSARGAKGPLPDPALLDGSAQPVEKKPDYGMLGEFEIPGDENVKGGKVGGQKGSPQGQQNQDPKISANMPGMPMGLPSGGGAGGQQGGLPGMPNPSMPQGAQGAQGGQGGQQQGGVPGALPGGTVDPAQANGQGGGTQLAGLKTDEANAGGVGGNEPNAPKPQQVALGDPAMQIKGVANAPGVVGAAAPSGQTQQMEKAVGGTGKGTSGDNSNKGVEKGRVVPAGL